MKNSCIVVIPAYQPDPGKWDMASFRQCLSVLRGHDICLVTFDTMDLSAYRSVAQELGKPYQVECFHREYFSSNSDYNRLCLSKAFYERFSGRYEYMLVCQLDAWVFSDQLQSWCDKGYDYIGAPVFRIMGGGRNDTHSTVLDGVGNGGFSLRRISWCLRVLDSCRHVPFLKPGYLAKMYYAGERSKGRPQIPALAISTLKATARSLGFRNTLSWFLSSNAFNEDFIFSVWACHSNVIRRVNIPEAREAALFAFEVHPSYLFGLTGQLPFGCHAFRKWEYDDFWSRYIHP